MFGETTHFYTILKDGAGATPNFGAVFVRRGHDKIS